MHSFFQLSFKPYIPSSGPVIGITTRNSLLRQTRMKQEKKKLLQRLELLIIDEISMVRSDALDAIDTLMREVRRQPLLPFGGIQVLYIGDMYQLPPVANEGEWQLLSDHYASPFFFDAKVIHETPPLYIELKKIYRQSDEQFINILNSVRNNSICYEQLQLLNSRYKPDFTPLQEDKYIILTTHNSKADHINNSELEKLPEKQYAFNAEISGEFNEKAMPAEPVLQLKEGAQVMFLKNDKGETRRYYNGKLATVKKVNYERIIVVPIGTTEEVVLEKETWKNISYKLGEGEIVEEELGTFKQYPVKLAWAVTIHKSQGLTFEKAIIDAGQAFAAGQVYVALSRCTSLEGIILHSRIGAHCINTDYRVVEFAQREASLEYLEPMLSKEKKAYELVQIRKIFEWEGMLNEVGKWQYDVPKRKLDRQAEVFKFSIDVMTRTIRQKEVAIKFQKQLDPIIIAIGARGAAEKLRERMNKAIGHFTKAIYEELIIPLKTHTEEIKSEKQAYKIKSYVEQLESLQTFLWYKIENLWNVTYEGKTFTEGLHEYKRHEVNDALVDMPAVVTNGSSMSSMPAPAHLAVSVDLSAPAIAPAPPTSRQPVGSTRKESLRHYQAGKTIDEIAKMRNLARGTIESHLAESIGLGEIELETVLAADKIAAIMPVVQKLGHVNLTPIREELGEDFTFTEIRMVAQHVKRMTTPAQ